MNELALMAWALAAITAVAMLRVAISSRGERTWRRALLGAGQIALAALLWCVLVPPSQPGRSGALVLLTEGADTDALESAHGDRVLSLPGAPAFEGAEPVPDLGTALRRHPDARPVRVLGHGLAARDRDAARGLGFGFVPAPLPETLVALSLPDTIVRGRRFELAGRITGHAGGEVELLDPAGERIDRAALDEAGGFRLTGVAGPAGAADYRLQWRREGDDDDAGGIALPLRAAEGAPLRVLVLAGGASPELKYLRRWALDGGLALGSQLRLGAGIVLGDDRAALTAARLAELDLVVIDERAWRALGAGGQATLRDAVRDGLGLMLRLGDDPNAAERRVLADWGFTVTPADVPRGLRLPGTAQADAATPGTDDAEARATDAAPLLSRRPLQLAAADGAPLATGDQGEVVGLWRPEGRGRIALWTLSDTFRLALAGRQAAYGSLWSQAFGTLARARGEPAMAVPAQAWTEERSALCGVTDDTRLTDPAGETIALAPDPATGAAACAAFWPTRAGWHLRRDGEREQAFLVRAPAEAPGLHAAQRQQETAALAGRAAAGGTTPAPVPGPRWPWALAWLLLAGGLWWFERSRRGRAPTYAGG
ncbi:hypothetical protein [Arenimonas metalli]|uniref:Carboxypeptidase regulatory-like domain-containing protein n=1 Tax=Arenimonas metalli CF5-1 TaxID=1384056 RepID=A0A091B613_9GAMM|nr:hypothetical protein [Arenimonas metalli]KFN48073.1 hypothetical protein N787_06445 [Arenimonas metalli CF5-1]